MIWCCLFYDTGFLVRLFVCRESEVGRTKFDPYVIGNNIRDLREKRKMTQMKLAEEMDKLNEAVMKLSSLPLFSEISLVKGLVFS